MQVRCPHCSNPVEILDGSSFRELSCGSCGSGFSLVPDETVSLKPQEARTLGHFELTERLGVGAFGTVWRARDTELDRTVAVKIPRKEQLSDDDVEQFLREARAAAQIKHPSIVGVHEVGRDDGVVFIVSDFIQGLTLADWLTGHQPPVRVAVELVAKVAEALEAAHEKGVIHRDLKPSNIMLDDDDEPHVMDFGLAKRVGAEITMTIDGQVLGTPAYMAPEQACGDAHTSDARSDIYSLGVILFEMITGELPFRGNARMLLHQVIKEEAPSPRKLNSNIPRDIETIALRCLEKDPANRFQSAAELSADLRRYLNHEPVHSRPIGAVARGKRWCKRNPVVSSLTGLIGTLLVLGIGAVSALWIQAESSAEQAQKFGTKYQAEAEKAQALAESENAARRAADLAREEAELAREAAELGLVDLYTTTGLTVESSQAPLWFANATEKAKGYPTRQQANRVRFATWRKPLCAPIAALDLKGERVSRIAWHPTLPVMLIEVLNKDLLLWDLRNDAPISLVGATSGSWSPDGTSLAISASQGGAVVFSFPGGEVIDQIASGGSVKAVAFAPNGEYLAIGAQSVRLWNTRAHRFAGGSFRHPSPIVGVAFSDDSKRLVTTCGSQEARVFAVGEKDLKPLFPPLPHWATHFGHKALGNRNSNPFSPLFLKNGKEILVSPTWQSLAWHDSTSGDKLREIEMGGHKDLPKKTPKGFGVGFRSFTRRAGSAQLAITTFYKSLLLETSSMSDAIGLGPHAHTTHCAAFSRDGGMVATGSRRVRFWRTADGTPVEGSEILHQDFVTVLEFSPQDDLLATVQYNGLVRVWSTPAANSAATRIPIEGGDYSLAEFSADGQFFLPTGVSVRLGEMKATRVFRSDSGKPAGPQLTPGGIIVGGVFSPDGNRLATISSDTESKDARMDWPGVAELDGRLDVWDWRNGRRLIETLKFPSEPRCVDYSPDGRQIAVICAKGELLLVDAESGAVRHRAEMGSSRNAINFLSNGLLRFSPAGDLLAAWGFQGGILVIDANTGRQVHLLRYSPRDVSFSPDGKLLATGNADKTARVWDLESGSQIGKPIEHPGWVHRVRFNEDGTQLLTSCRDHMARLWDWREGRLLCPAFKHDDEVMDARFIPGTPWVMTASHDATARVWDPETGKAITPAWPLGGMGWSIDLTSGGRFAVVGGQTKGVVRFDLSDLHQPAETPVDEMRTWAELVSGRAVQQGGGITNLTQSSWLKRWSKIQDSSSWSLLAGEPESLSAQVGNEAVANVRKSYATQFGWLQEVQQARDLIQRGKVPEAVSIYEQIVAKRPTNAQCWYALTTLHATQAKWQASMESAKRVIEIAPENASGHRALIRALANQKEYGSALTAADKLLELEDAQVDDWYTFALLVRATGDDSRYRSCCEDLVTRFGDVDDPNTSNTMVWICCLGPKPLPDVEPVLQRAQDAIQRGQASHALLNTLGAILLRAGKIPEARQRLKEAVESHEEDGTAWDHLFLAMAAQQDDQPGEYRKWLQEAKSWVATNLPRMVAADPVDGWRSRLELEILFREAEELAEERE